MLEANSKHGGRVGLVLALQVCADLRVRSTAEDLAFSSEKKGCVPKPLLIYDPYNHSAYRG